MMATLNGRINSLGLKAREDADVIRVLTKQIEKFETIVRDMNMELTNRSERDHEKLLGMFSDIVASQRNNDSSRQEQELKNHLMTDQSSASLLR